VEKKDGEALMGPEEVLQVMVLVKVVEAVENGGEEAIDKSMGLEKVLGWAVEVGEENDEGGVMRIEITGVVETKAQETATFNAADLNSADSLSKVNIAESVRIVPSLTIFQAATHKGNGEYPIRQSSNRSGTITTLGNESSRKLQPQMILSRSRGCGLVLSLS